MRAEGRWEKKGVIPRHEQRKEGGRTKEGEETRAGFGSETLAKYLL